MKTITTDKKISLYLCLSVALFLPIDYTKFSHSTPKHQAACNTCHKFPSKDWTKISSFPDVTDYPSHDACVSCHRPQFFRGVRPPICSVCHSKTSPRDEVRYAFRNPAAKLQFAIEFPHDKHQDAIALLRFAHPPQGYNNCTICHGPRTATFKAAPTDHGSCFNCHWKSQEPVAANCNGCHKLASAPYVLAEPERISAKFIHDGGGEKKQHVAECTTCHINITRASTLRGLTPDVPIAACASCHKDDKKITYPKAVTIEEEFAQNKQTGECTYCHTPDVGKKKPPPSHDAAAQ